MTSINCVNFRGSGAESAGSIAHNRNLNTCPTCHTNFKGKAENKEGKKSSFGKWVAGLTATAALAVIALGYGYKPALNKLKDGQLKNILTKAEPWATKCRGWCDAVVTKSQEAFGKIRDFFTKKQG